MSVESLTVELNRVKQLKNEISILYKELNLYLEEKTDKLTVALLDMGVCPRCGEPVSVEEIRTPALSLLSPLIDKSFIGEGLLWKCRCGMEHFLSNDTYTKLKETP